MDFETGGVLLPDHLERLCGAAVSLVHHAAVYPLEDGTFAVVSARACMGVIRPRSLTDPLSPAFPIDPARRRQRTGPHPQSEEREPQAGGSKAQRGH